MHLCADQNFPLFMTSLVMTATESQIKHQLGTLSCVWRTKSSVIIAESQYPPFFCQILFSLGEKKADRCLTQIAVKVELGPQIYIHIHQGA